jgi:galactokinase
VGLDITEHTRLRDIRDIDVIEILLEELPELMSAREAAHGLPIGVEALVRLSHGRLDHTARVPVKRLARHVLSEAARVDAAEAALKDGALEAFGRLLNESHDSLRQDYRCSTPALDRLCAAMRRAGAFGARLTGAGFGGYGLAACAPGHVGAVIEAAVGAGGGPAFEVRASAGLALL